MIDILDADLRRAAQGVKAGLKPADLFTNEYINPAIGLTRPRSSDREQGVRAAPPRAALLVRARHVLTSGPAGHLRDGAVAVAGDRIAAVGPYRAAAPGLPGRGGVGDGTGILTPGLISTHGHFSEGLVTGSARRTRSGSGSSTSSGRSSRT